jgi:hypothetical protein
MANPRKRKARIREALRLQAEQLATVGKEERSEAEWLVRRAAEIAVAVGKLTQEQIDEALAPLNKTEKEDVVDKEPLKKPIKKQPTKKPTKKPTRKRTTRKRTTKAKK